MAETNIVEVLQKIQDSFGSETKENMKPLISQSLADWASRTFVNIEDKKRMTIED